MGSSGERGNGLHKRLLLPGKLVAFLFGLLISSPNVVQVHGSVNLLSRNVRKYKEKAAAKYQQLQEEHKESRRKREVNREHRALVAKHRTLVAKCERLNKTVVLWKAVRVQCTREHFRRPESCEAEFGPKVAAAEVDLDNAVRDLNALADDMVPQAHATAPAEARYAEELPVLNGNADIVPSSVAHHLSPVENNAADDLRPRARERPLGRCGVCDTSPEGDSDVVGHGCEGQG
jgi:hypothetical protein